MGCIFKRSLQPTLFVLVVLLSPIYSFGQKWKLLSGLPASEAMKCVHFVDETTGWVGGENGIIITTTDGGKSWNSQSSNTNETLRGIFFIDSHVGWACGDQGTIISTSDGGANWKSQKSGISTQLNGVEFYSTKIGWVVGLNNQLLNTTDGGATWSLQLNQGGNMWGISVLSSTSAWSAGDFNSVKGSPRLLNTNDGTKWTNYYTSGVTSFSGFNDIHFVDANTGWVIGTNGIIRQTTNGGTTTTWNTQNSGTTYELLSIDFIDKNSGHACGRQGIIISTTNGGNTWNGEYSGYTSGTIWEIDMVNDSVGFAVGDMGVLAYEKYSPAQPIELLQPNGKEIYQVATKRYIIWQAQPQVNNVRIEYSVDGGNQWLVVTNSTPAAAGSYAWNVPNNTSVNCLIRISNASNAKETDKSDSAFYIMNTPLGIDYSVLTHAIVSNNPPQINIKWQTDLNALSYEVDKKLPSDTAWTFLATLSGNDSFYVDLNVASGILYEYRITKLTPLLTGYGYVYSGIEIPEKESNEIVLLAVDKNYSTKLTSSLSQFENDLIGDGWIVRRKDFDSSTTDVQLKQWVSDSYNQSGKAVSSLIIVGHFAIPYSGNYAPDGHTERIGAQPADVFFGDIDGNWTDNSVTTNNKGTIYTPNMPNDGIWDQNNIPSEVEISVGRIDMYNMTGFGISEIDLYKRYFTKNHEFRQGITSPSAKSIVNTHLDYSLPATSAVAWRSFSPLVGPNKISTVNTNGCSGLGTCQAFIDSVNKGSYLWAYMAGGGTDTSAGGDVFNSSHCRQRTINAVFMQLYGSYFVEWAKGGIPTPNPLLRAPLAAKGLNLATCWTGGGPRWYFHHMAMGKNIGFALAKSQNNKSIYDPGNNQHLGGIHMALMGDPTLRMHIVKPIDSLAIKSISGGLKVVWNSSKAKNLAGYHIYRSDSTNGIFSKLNSTIITDTSFLDYSPNKTGQNVYMVRVVARELSASGTYYNMSEGCFGSSGYVPTQLEMAKSMSNIGFFPNPVGDILTFQQVETNVVVTDLMGKTVLNNIQPTKQISMTSIPNGIYLITSNSGKAIVVVVH